MMIVQTHVLFIHTKILFFPGELTLKEKKKKHHPAEAAWESLREVQMCPCSPVCGPVAPFPANWNLVLVPLRSRFNS